MDRSLEALFEQLQADGRLDSSGRFSVDRFKERAKLSRFQLSHPGFWLLKLIQGAVALQAESIHIKLASNVELAFPTAHPEGLKDLVSCLFDPGAPAHPGARELSVGLLAVADQAQGLSVDCWSPAGDGFRLEVEGDGHRLLAPRGPPRKSTAGGYCSVVLRRKGAWKGPLGAWLQSLGGCRAERAALHWRSALAPVEIRVNGGRLTPPLELQAEDLPEAKEFPELGQLMGQLCGCGPPYLAVRRYLTDASSGFAVPLGLPLEEGQDISRVSRTPEGARLAQWLAPAGPGPFTRCRCALLLPPPGPSSGLLLPLRYGVLLDPEPVDLGLPLAAATSRDQALALVDASDLAVDLSHFRLVHDQGYDRLVADVRSQVQELRAGYKRCLLDLTPWSPAPDPIPD